MTSKARLTLHTMLGNYPNTKAIKSGELRSELVDFDFVEVKVANNLFKQIVRDAKYDLAELAIVTYMQARAYGKPYVLLPAVLVARGQHHTIAYDAERGPLAPSDLAGKRVGVRVYTVTTGTWVRGILASDYGVDLDKVEWITFEDPHVAEYSDPDIVKRAPPNKELVRMLLDGEIDAAVVGDKLPDPRLKHLIPDADVAARRWAERHHGCRSITWWSCARNFQHRGLTSCKTFFACCAKARKRLARSRPDQGSIRSDSVSKPADQRSKSSSTTVSDRGSSSSPSRSTICLTTQRADWGRDQIAGTISTRQRGYTCRRSALP
jgi:hypothetical protein